MGVLLRLQRLQVYAHIKSYLTMASITNYQNFSLLVSLLLSVGSSFVIYQRQILTLLSWFRLIGTFSFHFITF